MLAVLAGMVTWFVYIVFVNPPQPTVTVNLKALSTKPPYKTYVGPDLLCLCGGGCYFSTGLISGVMEDQRKCVYLDYGEEVPKANNVFGYHSNAQLAHALLCITTSKIVGGVELNPYNALATARKSEILYTEPLHEVTEIGGWKIDGATPDGIIEDGTIGANPLILAGVASFRLSHVIGLANDTLDSWRVENTSVANPIAATKGYLYCCKARFAAADSTAVIIKDSKGVDVTSTKPLNCNTAGVQVALLTMTSTYEEMVLVRTLDLLILISLGGGYFGLMMSFSQKIYDVCMKFGVGVDDEGFPMFLI